MVADDVPNAIMMLYNDGNVANIFQMAISRGNTILKQQMDVTGKVTPV
jgi:hypothetical protein